MEVSSIVKDIMNVYVPKFPQWKLYIKILFLKTTLSKCFSDIRTVTAISIFEKTILINYKINNFHSTYVTQINVECS